MVDTGDLKSPARFRASRFKSGRRYHPSPFQTCLELCRDWPLTKPVTTYLLSLILLPVSCLAQQPVTVERIADGARIEHMLNEAQSRATAEFNEKATNVTLTYSSPGVLNVLILYVDRNGQFSPLDTLVATLPAGTRVTTEIDLTKSSGWVPRTRTYRMHFLSNTSEGASFEDIEFTGGSTLQLIVAGLTQLVRPLPFTPSSYHRLPSYELFGLPLIPLVGTATVLLCLLTYRKHRRRAVCILIGGLLLVGLRSSVDSIYFSVSHLHSWLRSDTYATAGALPAIAQDLLREQSTGVYLCHTGTSYAKRVLAYHAYPVPVRTTQISHAVVHASGDWSYEGGTLSCGRDRFSAKQIKVYPDGSLLFSIRGS